MTIVTTKSIATATKKALQNNSGGDEQVPLLHIRLFVRRIGVAFFCAIFCKRMRFFRTKRGAPCGAPKGVRQIPAVLARGAQYAEKLLSESVISTFCVSPFLVTSSVTVSPGRA